MVNRNYMYLKIHLTIMSPFLHIYTDDEASDTSTLLQCKLWSSIGFGLLLTIGNSEIEEGYV